MKSYQIYLDASTGEPVSGIKCIDQETGMISFIPNDPDNRDWREYQAWLAQGNEPESAD